MPATREKSCTVTVDARPWQPGVMVGTVKLLRSGDGLMVKIAVEKQPVEVAT